MNEVNAMAPDTIASSKQILMILLYPSAKSVRSSKRQFEPSSDVSTMSHAADAACHRPAQSHVVLSAAPSAVSLAWHSATP